MRPIGYVRKKRSSEINASPWGVQYILRGEGDYPYDRLMRLAGESGVKWARLTRAWPQVEVEKGRYEWGLLDQAVDGLVAHGIELFMGTSARSHHAYLDFPEGYYYPPTPSPEAMAGFCRYMAAMVERYRDRVRRYEVWNEPNHPRYWRPEPDPAAYAMLVREAARAMRAIDPAIQVVGGVLAGINPEVVAYARDFLAEPGTAEAMDILTYHPYNPTPEATVADITALAQVLRQAKPGLAMWQGECGCPSAGDTIHFRGDAPWGYNVQAKWLLRRLLTDYLAGAEVTVYFLLTEFHGNVVNGDPTSRLGYNTKGLVQHTTWEAKPAYYALQNLTAMIDASWKRAEHKADFDVVDPGIFYGIGPHEDRFPCLPWQLGLRRGDTPMLAYWLPWRPQEIVRPATVRVSWPGVRWHNPACVDLLSGAVSEAVAVGGAVEVSLADYPMLLTERNALDLVDGPQQPAYDEIVSKLRWTY